MAGAAVTLAACGASNSPPIASLANDTGTGGATRTTAIAETTSTDGGGGTSTTAPAKNNPTKLVDEWAACQRSHGNPGQADPIIDAHGVINITIPAGAHPIGDPHDVGGQCSQYLAGAQSALRAADPVQPPPDQNQLLAYVNCMRANGVPNYPYPTGDKTDFNGTGVDPTSPFVTRASEQCGTKLHLPLWWAAGWGPPGDVSVRQANVPGVPRGGETVGPGGGPPQGSPGSGANGA